MQNLLNINSVTTYLHVMYVFLVVMCRLCCVAGSVRITVQIPTQVEHEYIYTSPLTWSSPRMGQRFETRCIAMDAIFFPG